MRRLTQIIASFLAALMLSGCAGSLFDSADNDQLKVIASIYPMYDFARKIGGEHADVVQLIPAGFEPHSWEPSTRDMLSFEQADVFVYNGAGLEQWADTVISSVNNTDLISVNASEGIPLIAPGAYSIIDGTPLSSTSPNTVSPETDDEEHHGQYDPHVWLDPKNAKMQMQSICDAFCLADPDNAEYYQANLSKYAGELDLLDLEFSETLLAKKTSYIVVAHEAFGYLCKSYGLLQIPIRGISANAGPDAARMREIIDFVNTYNVKVIFFEELASPKVSEVIASETGCITMALNPLGGLTQEQIDDGQEYFSIMRNNLEALAYALNTQ
jgi:zinc transport system substrate-binding protein